MLPRQDDLRLLSPERRGAAEDRQTRPCQATRGACACSPIAPGGLRVAAPVVGWLAATGVAIASANNRRSATSEPFQEGGEGVTKEVILKSFEHPDEARIFEKGRFEIVRLGGLTIGRAQYEPGWRWSTHVRPLAGTELCEVEHVGMVISGRAVAAMSDGTQIELTAGSLFYIPPIPHDSWVVGDEPYISLHFQGADHYSR
jgi:hypothetical protein